MESDSIRRAATTDVPAIERIVAAAFSKYIERLGKPPGPMLDDYGRRVAEATGFVLTASGSIIGALVLLPEPGHLWIETIAVDPDRQGAGDGKRLLSFAEEEARRAGYRELRLCTNLLMHENRAMYAHLGWQEYDRGEQAGYQRVFLRKDISML